MKKIGIFGGVFNPPHNSHINVANEILKLDNSFEKVIFVPVSSNYKKPEIINAEDRYNMLKLACENQENLEISRIEIDQKEQFFAYQTLDELKKQYPNHQLVFIIGTDSLKTLDTWKNLDYLLTTYSFLVYPRGNDNFDEILNNNKPLSPYINHINYLDTNYISDLSSTKIRNMLKTNQNIDDLIPISVFKYIQNKKLYKKP